MIIKLCSLQQSVKILLNVLIIITQFETFGKKCKEKLLRL